MTLFGDEPAPKPISVKPFTPAVPKWTKCNTQAKCHDCTASQHRGAAILARKAQWWREYGGAKTPLCYVHAIPRRDADEEAARKAEIA